MCSRQCKPTVFINCLYCFCCVVVKTRVHDQEDTNAWGKTKKSCVREGVWFDQTIPHCSDFVLVVLTATVKGCKIKV